MPSYSEPVQQLLHLGRPDPDKEELDYTAFGITGEHTHELLRMVFDDELNEADVESTAVWAPLHAMHALGQLEAPEAIEGLLPAIEKFIDDDWFGEDLPEAYALLGPAALPALRAYLADPDHTLPAHACITDCLTHIAHRTPEARPDCIAILRDQLSHAQSQNEELNAFLVAALMDLKAVEALEEIRGVFEQNLVNINITGDLEDVEIELGVRTERTTPQPRYNVPGPDFLEEVPEPFVRTEPKVGRNDPCPCGSGKKYKKCCEA